MINPNDFLLTPGHIDVIAQVDDAIVAANGWSDTFSALDRDVKDSLMQLEIMATLENQYEIEDSKDARRR